MKILSFVARNHRSFRDEFFLDMTRESLKTNVPRAGESWSDHLFPVAGIFGANASGKTSVIRAFEYVYAAILSSSGEWSDKRVFPRDPFRLDSHSRSSESFYALDFLLDMTEEQASHFNKPTGSDRTFRFTYEFSVDPQGIKHEFLQVYLSSRPTVLVERERSDVRLGARLGSIEVSPSELVLSRVLRVNRGILTSISESIVEGLHIFHVGDRERDSRLSYIAKEVANNRLDLKDLIDLARIADVGVENITVDEEEFPPDILPDLKEYLAKFSGGSEPLEDTGNNSDATSHEPAEADALVRSIFPRSLRFEHRADGTADQADSFSLEDESSGTLAWLALAIDALTALRKGTVLCVDELDTSLHPQLAALLVSLFQNPEHNPRGAQLIFTSHDVSLLSAHSGLDLHKRQIWYVDKDNSGASELYSLGDFTDVKKNSNITKQYLEGRFGAVPRLAPSLIYRLIGKPDSPSTAITEEAS
ncbi:AAA family ATPase [Trueperella bialowiezensis]|uniref:Predicted ATPase n=1 Tax=Trueperella bialowiezensis TaxID=312285 RepID=A0A3S4VBC7_9ACTO|nr:ATP-binding protein [Trueperella bialowiezensis]VEI13742.1 Predicted ATPase [Trueperella bialowiezensis]